MLVFSSTDPVFYPIPQERDKEDFETETCFAAGVDPVLDKM